ncbi:MAG: molybdopterin molybdotransferase MoeA [Oscillospiraceae bacterium]|jgi:molybdopterin molybdotransferase/putative molybdopterin biosynthesis protein|nr:molybdopterin molybdotransferase MoeA [Oscillospiraceae bacterium]
MAMQRIEPGELPTRAEVLAKLFSKWSAPIRTERVRTEDALYRILAADVFSLCDKPVFRGSRMDGVAVKSEMFKDGVPDASEWKLGTDYVRADTGDDFDDAFDAVIAVEDLEFLPNGGLKFNNDLEPVTAGAEIANRGDSIARDMLLCEKGTRLLAVDLAAIAMGAVSEIEVYKKPVAAFIPTGSELIPLGQLPKRGETVCSNSILAKCMLEEMGAVGLTFDPVADNPKELSAALDKALSEADVVILSAGTSKGSEDYCHTLLAERGELIFHGVASAPGRPMAGAIVDGKPVINVAGPPTACFNGLEWCVKAVVCKFCEQNPLKRHTVLATLSGDIHSGGVGFESFVRLKLEKTDSGYIAHPMPHRATRTPDSIRAEGLYITKLEPEAQSKGDVIEVELLR